MRHGEASSPPVGPGTKFWVGPAAIAELVIGTRAQAREQLERAHAELSAAGMNLHATLASRRLGKLIGGAEGARAVAEADAWLAAQGVRAPERLARVFMPEVT